MLSQDNHSVDEFLLFLFLYLKAQKSHFLKKKFSSEISNGSLFKLL